MIITMTIAVLIQAVAADAPLTREEVIQNHVRTAGYFGHREERRRLENESIRARGHIPTTWRCNRANDLERIVADLDKTITTRRLFIFNTPGRTPAMRDLTDAEVGTVQSLRSELDVERRIADRDCQSGR